MKKVFSAIYFLFSFLLIICTFFYYDTTRVLGFILALGLIILMYKKPKILNNKKLNILLTIGILIRIILIFLNYGEPYSDYQNFYNSSINFANYGTINKYIEVFPHLIYYIICLGSIFKLFGTSYTLVVILNVFIDILATLILIKFFKSKTAGVIWLLNPINIMWCSIAHPTVITNFFLLLSFLILFKLLNSLNKNNKKDLYKKAIFFSAILSIANLFRPIMIILLIALLIYFFILKISKKDLKKYLIVTIIILGSYLIFNKSISFMTNNLLSNNIADTTVGWNIYVGSNMKSNGTWNEEQQIEFNKLFNSNTSPNEIQEHFLEKGVNQYKNNGLINNIKLFIKKAIVLVGSPDSLTCYVFNKMQSNSIPNYIQFILKIITSTSYYILLLFNIIFAYKKLRNINRNDDVYILQLFIIGVISSHLLVEVSPRYCLMLIVPYTLLILISKKDFLLDNKT